MPQGKGKAAAGHSDASQPHSTQASTAREHNNRPAKEAGVQLDALEVIGRYGKEQGTQLRKEQPSFMERALMYRVGDIGLNAINVRLIAALMNATNPEDDENTFADMPINLHPHMKLLRRVCIAYLHPDRLRDPAYEIEWINLEKDLALAEAGATKSQLEAIKIIKRAQANKVPLTEDELHQVFNAYGDEIDKLRLGMGPLNALFDALVKDQVLMDEDVKGYREKLNERMRFASDGQEFITFGNLVPLMEPDMEEARGHWVATTRRLAASPHMRRGSAVTEDLGAAKSKGVHIPAGFFGPTPEEDEDIRDLQEKRITGDLAEAMAVGSNRPDQEHHAVWLEEYKALQELMEDLAVMCFCARPFEAKQATDVSERSVALQSIAQPSMAEKSLRSIADPSRMSMRTASIKLSVAQTPADKNRYMKLLKILRMDGEFMNDPEKNAAVRKLETAVEKDIALEVAEIEEIMTAISKDVLIPDHAVEKVVERMIGAKSMEPKDKNAFMAEVVQTRGTRKGLKMPELQKIISKYSTNPGQDKELLEGVQNA